MTPVRTRSVGQGSWRCEEDFGRFGLMSEYKSIMPVSQVASSLSSLNITLIPLYDDVPHQSH